MVIHLWCPCFIIEDVQCVGFFVLHSFICTYISASEYRRQLKCIIQWPTGICVMDTAKTHREWDTALPDPAGVPSERFGGWSSLLSSQGGESGSAGRDSGLREKTINWEKIPGSAAKHLTGPTHGHEEGGQRARRRSKWHTYFQEERMETAADDRKLRYARSIKLLRLTGFWLTR